MTNQPGLFWFGWNNSGRVSCWCVEQTCQFSARTSNLPFYSQFQTCFTDFPSLPVSWVVDMELTVTSGLEERLGVERTREQGDSGFIQEKRLQVGLASLPDSLSSHLPTQAELPTPIWFHSVVADTTYQGRHPPSLNFPTCCLPAYIQPSPSWRRREGPSLPSVPLDRPLPEHLPVS